MRSLLSTILLAAMVVLPIPAGAQARSESSIPHVRSERPSGATYRLANAPLWSIPLRGDTAAPRLDIVGAVRLRDGRVVVADGANSSIRFYASSLRLDTTIALPTAGRRRVRLSGLQRVEGDSLAVLANAAGWLIDPARSIHAIGPPSIHLGQDDILTIMGMFRDGSSLWSVYDLTNQRRPPAKRWTDSASVIRFAPGGEVQNVARLPYMQLVDRGPGNGFELWFAPYLAFTIHGESFFHGYSTDYVITRRNALTGHEERWERRWTKRPVTSADVTEFIDGWSLSWNRGPDSTAVKAAMRNQPYADSVPAFSQFLASLDGELWVRATNLADAQGNGSLFTVPYRPSVWSVFDPRGRWTSDVTLPAGFQPTDIGTDYVLGVQYGMRHGLPRGRERSVVLYHYEKRRR